MRMVSSYFLDAHSSREAGSGWMVPPPGADTEAASDGLAFFLFELVSIVNLLPVNPFSR